ncbi:MAG: AIM24 family protein [Oscillospiraceae bacterium]|nr:AIM24 family protein [Oscillospiraceae bacterium]
MRYDITGEPMPVVICRLEAGESMITEGGSMVWMSPNMKMETVGGGFGKILGRLFSGERLFQNIYTAEGGEGLIAFANSFPGSLRAVEITPDKPLICQKSAFLAATKGVELSVFFQKKIGAGLFGGEGFVMQKISGSGTAFVEFDGSTVEYELGAGQQIIVDTGNLAMMDESCSVDIETVKGAKNIFLGGEGIFHTVVTGPGRVTLQTMPLSAFAQNLIPYLPTSTTSVNVGD